MSKQKGFSMIIVLAIIAIVIAGGLFFYFKMNGSTTNTTPSVPQVMETPTRSQDTSQSMKKSDLDTASANLDSTQFTEIDTELSQLDNDSSW